MHPLIEAVDTVRGTLTSVDAVSPVFMDTGDKQCLLVELAAVEAQVASLRMRVLATANDVAESSAARDAGVWVATATRARRGDVAADVRLAEALDTRIREAYPKKLAAAFTQLLEDLDPTRLPSTVGTPPPSWSP